MNSVRRLAAPRRARVSTNAEGTPTAVDGHEVDAIRETWLLEDRWWSEQPLRRRYWEVVTTGGFDQVVFHDLIGRGWWAQR